MNVIKSWVQIYTLFQTLCHYFKSVQPVFPNCEMFLRFPLRFIFQTRGWIGCSLFSFRRCDICVTHRNKTVMYAWHIEIKQRLTHLSRQCLSHFEPPVTSTFQKTNQLRTLAKDDGGCGPSPVATGRFGGLSPPKQSPSPPQLKYEI